ncbi:MAG: hypothetical protein MHMPM18_000985 [Marteilia pararefringens]
MSDAPRPPQNQRDFTAMRFQYPKHKRASDASNQRPAAATAARDAAPKGETPPQNKNANYMSRNHEGSRNYDRTHQRTQNNYNMKSNMPNLSNPPMVVTDPSMTNPYNAYKSQDVKSMPREQPQALSFFNKKAPNVSKNLSEYQRPNDQLNYRSEKYSINQNSSAVNKSDAFNLSELSQALNQKNPTTNVESVPIKSTEYSHEEISTSVIIEDKKGTRSSFVSKYSSQMKQHHELIQNSTRALPAHQQSNVENNGKTFLNVQSNQSAMQSSSDLNQKKSEESKGFAHKINQLATHVFYNVMIRNIPLYTTDDTLQGVLADFKSDIDSFELLTENGSFAGRCIVKMKSQDAQEALVKCSKLFTIDDNPLDISFDHNRNNSGNRMQNRGGGRDNMGHRGRSHSLSYNQADGRGGYRNSRAEYRNNSRSSSYMHNDSNNPGRDNFDYNDSNRSYMHRQSDSFLHNSGNVNRNQHADNVMSVLNRTSPDSRNNRNDQDGLHSMRNFRN